jgi:UDP-N-acetyl-D-mannosaminuronate dehydrogenase
MRSPQTVVVVGLGEVGRPLLEHVAARHRAMGVDISPPAQPPGPVDVMHVCYPFEIAAFVDVTADYIARFRPALTIVNSTVAVGTTRAIATRTGADVVHSPIRGKHARMRQELLHYTKFVGALEGAAGQRAVEHFESIGMRARTLASPEATELAKLTETTYFGLLIGWAQEVERYCGELGTEYDEVVSFYQEVPFFPPVTYFPGIIGGHCVIPNIEILSRVGPSEILQAILSSNRQKAEREAERAAAGLPAGATS